ncbi:MAG: wax ester/triacylglycerol synthase family O-acyltransferase [Endozoicomonas sp. (ex Botrylloides leachii)]|nr:wax ester/triacylglycerol synthase family O-acyltransferase [Endozoicomonas sp. (ex Botrylloides leachii)]
MEQLSALDTALINMETGTTPMHIGCLAIYDPSTSSQKTTDFKKILNYLKGRIYKTTDLRNRYVQVPIGLDYPYWITDPDFDVEFHVRDIGLPAPGDWQQLCTQIARIHSRPLDMSRPPWEIYIIEGLDSIKGLPKGCYAMLFKIHHALIDGQGGAILLAAMHDLSPGAKQIDSQQPLIVDRVPTAVELLARASINSYTNIWKRSKVVTKYTLPLLRGTLRKAFSGKNSASNIVPKTRFNKKVSPHRVFEAVDFQLTDIKRVATAFNKFKVNDVVIAIVSGALRRYLTHKGELPSTSMTAMTPVSIRRKKEGLHSFNQFSFMFPSIYTDIADPIDRLHAIHEANAKAKSNHENMGSMELMDATQLLPNTVTNLLARTITKYNLLSHINPLFNTVITNVPGPQIPLYQSGAKLMRFYGTGICWDSVGLFHIIFSYNGSLTISATCCRNMMPDPVFYAECLRESFNDLTKAVEKTIYKQNGIPACKPMIQEGSLARPHEKVVSKTTKIADEQKYKQTPPVVKRVAVVTGKKD